MSTAQQKDLDFWKKKIKGEGGKLKNSWYQKLFTSQFTIPLGFYTDKKVLDIGSGPRGTLEWADKAQERIGLDRYAEGYAELGTDEQKMEYVSATAESIPFDDNYFEIISAFNTIEYINEPQIVFQEIKRVLKPGGICLLLCDINTGYQQKNQINSPNDFTELLKQNWEIVEAQYYEKKSSGIYKCIDDAVSYDFQDASERSFIASIIINKTNPVEVVVSSQPKVSIIIPVEQNISYLWQAFESIFQQTYTDYEILVVDNSCNSKVSDRLKPYINNIKYIKEENLDTVSILNKAISQARGELITFLDSNNFWNRTDRLTRQVHRFNIQATLGLLHSGWSVVDEIDNKILDVEPWHKISELDLKAWLQYQYVDLNALMISKKWLDKVGGFDSQLKTFYALDLVLRLSLAGCKGSWLKQITTTNRKYQNTKNTNNPSDSETLLDILNRFFSRPDLSHDIKQLESDIRYNSIIQTAWDNYNLGRLSLAVKYLSKSKQFSPYLRVETISDWIERFTILSQEANSQFDVDSLCDLSEWKNLVMV